LVLVVVFFSHSGAYYLVMIRVEAVMHFLLLFADALLVYGVLIAV